MSTFNLQRVVEPPRIDFARTWSRLAKAFDNPDSVRPEQPPASLVPLLMRKHKPRKLKLPQLRGNVYNTATQIYAIFMQQYAVKKGRVNKAIRTTCLSLAKRCKYKDPKTAYRHILTLIEAGILRGKVRLNGAIELLLNETLLAYREATAVTSGQNHAPQMAVDAELPPADINNVEDTPEAWREILKKAFELGAKNLANAPQRPFS